MKRRSRKPPLLSQAGNPFPPGLKPVFVPLTPPTHGRTWDDVWPRPLPQDPPPPDYSGLIATSEYRFEDFAPGEDWPRFTLRLSPRREDETEAQYEWYRRGIERHYLEHGVTLGLMRMLATALGNFRRCGGDACKRAGACAGRRDEDRFELSLAVLPPCVPLDLDIIESYRAEVRAELLRAERAAGASPAKA